MEAAGFPRDDKPYLLVVEAYNAVHALSVELHYLSCKSGVRRPLRK
jgi:hypothetical protein